MNPSRLPFVIVAVTCASAGYSYQQTHYPTSRDAFLHVQYGTKAEFIAGLRNHPKELYQLAKHFNTGQTRLLDYIQNYVKLSTLKNSGTYRVWGIKSNGTTYSVSGHFPKGMKVWSTLDGTPIMRWNCANPMVASLPVMEEPTPPPPPPPVEEEPPPPPPPPPVEVEEPPPPPPPPVVVEPPPPPPPVVVVTPPPPPPPPPVIVEETYEVYRTEPRWSVWLGVFEYDRLLKLDRVWNLSYGASYDLYQSNYGTKFGLYIEGGGHLNNDHDFEYWGGGLQVRQVVAGYGHKVQGYVGIGGGYYDYRIDDFDKLHVGFFEHHSQFGGRAFVGVDLNDHWFIEGQALLLGEFRGRTLNRYGLNIGYRF